MKGDESENQDWQKKGKGGGTRREDFRRNVRKVKKKGKQNLQKESTRRREGEKGGGEDEPR